jgi:hypothetical protein
MQQVWEKLVPFFKGTIGGKDDGLALVATIDDFVE